MAQHKEPTLTEQLKEAIRASGKSLYQISRESGVASPQLYRFVNGDRSLTLPAVDKICRALRLQLVSQAEAPPAKKGRKK